jgi:dihydrofolate reductase
VEFRGLGANVGRFFRAPGVARPKFGVAWPIGAATASREPESEWFKGLASTSVGSPPPAGDPFGDLMNAPAKYVVSRTLGTPVWRNTTIIRDDVVESVRKLKAAPGKTIMTDGSHELVHTLLQHDLVDELHLLLYPLVLGTGKKLFPSGPAGARLPFRLESAKPYPSGVVGLHYVRAR